MRIKNTLITQTNPRDYQSDLKSINIGTKKILGAVKRYLYLSCIMIICMVKKSTKATTFIIYCRQIHRLRTDAIFSYDKNVEHASKWKRIIVLQLLKTKPLFNKHIDNKLQCYLFQYCLVLINLSDCIYFIQIILLPWKWSKLGLQLFAYYLFN